MACQITDSFIVSSEFFRLIKKESNKFGHHRGTILRKAFACHGVLMNRADWPSCDLNWCELFSLITISPVHTVTLPWKYHQTGVVEWQWTICIEIFYLKWDFSISIHTVIALVPRGTGLIFILLEETIHYQSMFSSETWKRPSLVHSMSGPIAQLV